MTQTEPIWRLGNGRAIALDRPRIVAVLNLTDDSFYSGSRVDGARAVEAALRAVADGADAIDMGAESTRPGAARVPAEEQIARVRPAVSAMRRERGLHATPISVDTTLEAVALSALDAGADVINDVSAGAESAGGTLRVSAARGAGLILMHRLTTPERDRYSDRYDTPPVYGDVVAEVAATLAARASAARAEGVDPEAIAVDPGLGFGKDVEQNLELIRRTRELASLGYPVVSALSRKSFVGRVSLGRDSTPDERLAGTLALSVSHLRCGAVIFRVHDVREHREALDAAWALRATGGSRAPFAGPDRTG